MRSERQIKDQILYRKQNIEIFLTSLPNDCLFEYDHIQLRDPPPWSMGTSVRQDLNNACTCKVHDKMQRKFFIDFPNYRSRHCFPERPSKKDAKKHHFLTPYSSTSLINKSSSYMNKKSLLDNALGTG